MVFQSFNLISRMTRLENVELPLRFAEVDRGQRQSLARQALERVGLGKRLTHRPSELSGGEQQRAALARALINQPKLLLADEPTGNLDSRTGTEIMNFIREFNQSLGMTIVMVTHERALAERYAQRLIFLADGKLVDDQPNGAVSAAPAQRRPSVKTYDLAELAVRNLRESILRNSLTTIGISVGVASLVAMLSLGIGLQKLATRRLVKSGLFDTVVVTSRRDLRGFNPRRRNNAPFAAESRALDEPRAPEIAQLPNVLEAYPDIRFITAFTYRHKPHLTMVAGIPDFVPNQRRLRRNAGQFFLF